MNCVLISFCCCTTYSLATMYYLVESFVWLFLFFSLSPSLSLINLILSNIYYFCPDKLLISREYGISMSITLCRNQFTQQILWASSMYINDSSKGLHIFLATTWVHMVFLMEVLTLGQLLPPRRSQGLCCNLSYKPHCTPSERT